MKRRFWITTLSWGLLLAIISLAAGCTLVEGTPAPTNTPSPTETPTSAPTTPPSPTPTVKPTHTPEPETGTPALTVAPPQAAPGESVRLEARGFQPDTELEIGFGRVNSEYDVITTAQTDADGALDVTVTIPDFAESEDAWVFIAEAAQMPTQSASTRFDVLAAGAKTTPTPAGDLFTRTQITLIAIGDEGGLGKEIGCDDSAVPVEVTIEPTVAPLTAALEKLLAMDAEYYGESGLYNALYASDLTLEGVNIVQGKATIALSGELVLGGVCDNPRVEAQLRETALQYSTVEQVEILLNGEPLSEVLGQS